jgi:CDP-glucose 4,6-dehydratase
MHNILITGGVGFIGSHLAKNLSENNNVVVLQRDIIPSEWLLQALEKCTLVHGDVLDQKLLQRILADYQIDQIYHLAAQAVVSAANKDPYSTFNVNVLGTVNVLEAVRNTNPKIKVLIQSSDKVYGDNRTCMTEKDTLIPTVGIYETSKALEDLIAQAYYNQYGLDIKIARPCNCYGYDNIKRIIPNTVKSCLNSIPPIIFDGQEKTTRQYIYVEDMVDALTFIMDKGQNTAAEACTVPIFNVGTDDILTQEEVVKTIAEIFNMTIRVMKRTTPVKEIENQSVDYGKLKALGWTPKNSFRQGITKTVAAFQTYGWDQKEAADEKPLKYNLTDQDRKDVKEKIDGLYREYHQSLKLRAAANPYKKLIYCQATYSQDYEDTMRCVERVSPYVDAVIIVEPGDLTGDQKLALTVQNKADIFILKTYTFSDDLPAMRNVYLEEAKKLDPHAWMVVSDPDELISLDTCKNLREIVKQADAEGINMIGLNAHDIWIDSEKMDQGIAQKEAPYKESDFWKYLIFKIAPDFRYEGIGRSKNVHETWYAPSLYRAAYHLTKEFYYEHRKSLMKIYRNAARNLFIGGSGDNMGDNNPTFVELHKLTKELGVDTWGQFEAYMKAGAIDLKLLNFLVAHRSDSKYSWESEVREMFQWYFMMHPDENTSGWKSEYTAPAAGSREEVENYVTSVYFQVLGRCPDDMGKTHYVDAIMNGEIPRESLPSVFVNSDEYRMKFVSHLQDGVALCIMGYHDAMPMIMQSINICAPYVKEIHVQGDNFTQDDIETLSKYDAKVHIEPWKDEFSDYKNKAISHAKTKWVLILDHDEIPTPEMAKALPQLVEQSEYARRYNLVQFISLNQTIDASGKVVAECEGTGKELLHLNIKNPYYGNPHIWLKQNYYPWVGEKSTYKYRHVKEEGVDVLRAIRNVYLGGGGDNFREKNPLWPELRQITDRLGIKNYVELWKYLEQGNADPELKAWMDKAYQFPWHDNELKAFKTYYYQKHPEEK